MCEYTQNACLFHQLRQLGAPLGFAAVYGKWEQTCKAHENTGINPGKGNMPVAQECVMPISKRCKPPHLTFVEFFTFQWVPFPAYDSSSSKCRL